MKLLHTLEETLRKEPNYLTDDGHLKKWVIINKAQNHDEVLLGLLLSDPDLKEHFFRSIAGALVFNQPLFVEFMEQKNYLNDSFTAYKNKIGLSIGGKFLKQRNEVELVWPYKDCLLEGGQSREEQSREEIFFNQTLAQDEITQLLEPKVITNGYRYSTEAPDGEPVSDFSRNETGHITDNLIIKGNNLLALHSLKTHFAGRVKLIYIDPPYNTDNDSFQYNDSFKHSTWLTFMKNRLEIARELLATEGAIFIQISDVRSASIKVLLDEIFGIDNFINQITIRTKSPSGFKTVNLGLFETAEYIFVYGKNKKKWKYNPQFVKAEYDENYKFEIENINDPVSQWRVANIESKLLSNEGFNSIKEAKKKLGEGVWIEKKAQYAIENAHQVFRLTEINDDSSKETLIVKEKSLQFKNQILVVERIDKGNRYVYNGGEIAFYGKKMRDVDGEKVPTMLLTNIWTDIAYEGIANEGGVKLKKGKKPERLLKRVIEMSTDKGDIVMDFQLGSGTTCAVANKLARQYIGIEQLDYGKNDSLVRLKKVISGEQGGISKSVGWTGGGSFVYFELKKYNETFMEQIAEAPDSVALLTIWESMKQHSFLDYTIDLKTQDKHLEEFKTLSLRQQKELLASLLDKNQLYVSRSAMDDTDFGVTNEDKQLTIAFYGNE